MKTCQFCQNQVIDTAPNCPRCGGSHFAANIATQQTTQSFPYPPVNQQFTDATETNERMGAEGCLGGVIMGAIFTLVGVLLCFTVIGAIIGIPMIIAGMSGWAVMPFMRNKELHGSCPYCGHSATVSPTVAGYNCTACKKRVIVRNGQFHRIPD